MVVQRHIEKMVWRGDLQATANEQSAVRPINVSLDL
jgi:hypothetical protein